MNGIEVELGYILDAAYPEDGLVSKHYLLPFLLWAPR